MTLQDPAGPSCGDGAPVRDKQARSRTWLMIGLVAATPLMTLFSFAILIERGFPDELTFLLMTVDLALAIVALFALPGVLHRDTGPPAWSLDQAREQRALRLGILVIACSALSGAAILPAFVAVISLSARRRPRWIAAALLALMGVFGVGLLFEFQSTSARDLVLYAVTASCVAAVLVLTGLYHGSRRALMRSLRREAESARAREQARADQARQAERTRIAREMHDTVSHRLALVALHAGGLEYRKNLTPEQVRTTMGTIRQAVQEASEELANTLDVLRSDGGDALPPPTLIDLRDMIEAVGRTGTKVDMSIDIPDPEPPATLTAHLYRVVQESLTNALKHAPGQPISVRVEGTPSDGIEIEVTNSMPAQPGAAGGSRMGLVGLSERVKLAHGTFGAQQMGGHFAVRAWLPWHS